MHSWIFQALSFIVMILQVMILLAIKLNDIKHIENAVYDLKKEFDELNKQILEHEKRLSRIEGKLNGKN
jgi:cell division protein FtsL